ncbi:MAG: PIN domain-containing protein [Verrucomicrobiaceae bacterium]|nr:PIN domain-containing protein [Verrucomicrobiaceae bacterium]
MRVFLDTHIVLDVLLNRPGLVADSEAVILRCEAAGDPMFIAWHGLATAYYLLKRGRSEADALVEVDKILSWAQVADAVDANARSARAMGFGDFEDALQAACAESCAADMIVTRNITDFSKSQVPAITPQDFLQRFPAI